MLFLLAVVDDVLQTQMTISSLLLSDILRSGLHRIIVIYIDSLRDTLSFSSINRQSRNMILPLSFPRDKFITFPVYSYEKLQRVLNMVKLENLDLVISMRWEASDTEMSMYFTTTMKLISSCPNVRSLRFGHRASDTLLFLTGHHCHDLIQIDLSHCEHITDIGVMYLINQFPNLTRVNLSNTYITDESIVHLTTCCHKLRSLNLEGCQRLTDKSILSLLMCSCLIELNVKYVLNICVDNVSYLYKRMFVEYGHRVKIEMDRYELERHDFIDSKDMNMIRFTVT